MPACQTSAASRSLRARAKLPEPSSKLSENETLSAAASVPKFGERRRCGCVYSVITWEAELPSFSWDTPRAWPKLS